MNTAQLVPLPEIIILDCDGVILDSNKMKIEAFRKALSGYQESAIEQFSIYQAQNFGRSRYVLFKDFFQFLGREPETDEIKTLLDRYAAIVSLGYLDVCLTPDCLQMLEQLSAVRPVYIASGSDQEELRWVMNERGLTRYFSGIYGSPQSKVDILSSLAPVNLKRGLFVGDAQADFDAAQKFEWCDFVFMQKYSTASEDTVKLVKQVGLPIIDVLSDLWSLFVDY